jgi:hypothetical protein
VWSTKVTEKLNKRAKKSRPHRVDPYGSDQGDYEVIHRGEILSNSDFKKFNYIVHVEEGIMSKYMCLKLNLTSKPCSHTQQVSQSAQNSITVLPSRSNISNITFDAARHSISGVFLAISLNVHHNTNESGNYMS